jgi:hypothetical protein
MSWCYHQCPSCKKDYSHVIKSQVAPLDEYFRLCDECSKEGTHVAKAVIKNRTHPSELAPEFAERNCVAGLSPEDDRDTQEVLQDFDNLVTGQTSQLDDLLVERTVAAASRRLGE